MDPVNKLMKSIFPQYDLSGKFDKEKFEQEAEAYAQKHFPLRWAKKGGSMKKLCYMDRKGNWRDLPKDAVYSRMVKETALPNGRFKKEIISEGYIIPYINKEGKKDSFFVNKKNLSEQEGEEKTIFVVKKKKTSNANLESRKVSQRV